MTEHPEGKGVLMQDEPKHDEKKPTSQRIKPLLVAAAVIAVLGLLVVLNLTGVAPKH